MRLYVNVDHVATVREARKTNEPDPAQAAMFAELGGAHGITVHLREDRRHIQDRDVRVLMDTVRTGVNLELAVSSSDILGLACELKPKQATLVPERREEITTEGGLSLSSRERAAQVGRALVRLRQAGVRTSLFIDPDLESLAVALELGSDAVELHTGEYANASSGAARATELARLELAAEKAKEMGFAVHAGHGLTYENVIPVARILPIEELNIGHSIVSRSISTGMEAAVREMATLLRRARGAFD